MKKTYGKRGVHVIGSVALLAALFMTALCLTGCGAGNGNGQSGASGGVETAGRGINSSGLCDVCRIGDTIYFAPAWSIYSVPAGGGEAELMAMDMGCRMLSEYKGNLYFLAQKSVNGTDTLDTSIMTYSPADGSFETIYEHPLIQNGDYGNLFEIVTYSIRGGEIYFVTQENSGSAASSSVFSIPLGGGSAKLVAALPQDNLPLPYTDIIWYDGMLCFGAFKKESSYNFMMTVVPETGYTSEGFEWLGSADDRLFASGGGIIVCSSERGVMKFSSPDSQVHTSVIEDSGIRGFYMNDKYAVYSKTEEYLADGDTHYTQTAGIYVLDLSSGETTKIFDPYCELIGISGDRIFYFDESALSAFTEVSQLSGYTFRATLCSVKADGTDTAVLCSVDD